MPRPPKAKTAGKDPSTAAIGFETDIGKEHADTFPLSA